MNLFVLVSYSKENSISRVWVLITNWFEVSNWYLNNRIKGSGHWFLLQKTRLSTSSVWKSGRGVLEGDVWPCLTWVTRLAHWQVWPLGPLSYPCWLKRYYKQTPKCGNNLSVWKQACLPNQWTIGLTIMNKEAKLTLSRCQ